MDTKKVATILVELDIIQKQIDKIISELSIDNSNNVIVLEITLKNMKSLLADLEAINAKVKNSSN